MKIYSSPVTAQHSRMRLRLGVLLTSLAFVFTGCGAKSQGPQTTTVSGPITLDGAAISEGHIIFKRLDGNLKSFGGQIKNGHYSIQAEPGEVAVSVVATREVPGKFSTENGMKEPLVESYIPERYNSKTELKLTVTDQKQQSAPFELTSKK